MLSFVHLEFPCIRGSQILTFYSVSQNNWFVPKLNHTVWIKRLYIFWLLKRINLFIYHKNRGRGEGKERIWSRLHTEYGAQRGTCFPNPEIMIWAEIKNWMLNWLSHPEAPVLLSYRQKHLFSFSFFLNVLYYSDTYF